MYVIHLGEGARTVGAHARKRLAPLSQPQRALGLARAAARDQIPLLHQGAHHTQSVVYGAVCLIQHFISLRPASGIE